MTDEKPIRLRVVSVMTDPDGGRHESKTVHRGTLRAGEDGQYGTAYGDIPVAVYTREVLTEEGENGGEMRLDYDVFVGGERTSATVMTLVWRL